MRVFKVSTLCLVAEKLKPVGQILIFLGNQTENRKYEDSRKGKIDTWESKLSSS